MEDGYGSFDEEQLEQERNIARFNAAAMQNELAEALLKIELLENTINDLHLRIAFLES